MHVNSAFDSNISRRDQIWEQKRLQYQQKAQNPSSYVKPPINTILPKQTIPTEHVSNEQNYALNARQNEIYSNMKERRPPSVERNRELDEKYGKYFNSPSQSVNEKDSLAEAFARSPQNGIMFGESNSRKPNVSNQRQMLDEQLKMRAINNRQVVNTQDEGFWLADRTVDKPIEDYRRELDRQVQERLAKKRIVQTPTSYDYDNQPSHLNTYNAYHQTEYHEQQTANNSVGKKYGPRSQTTSQNYADELAAQIRMKEQRKAAEKKRLEQWEMEKEKEIESYDPFGKPGAGAPIRDSNGKIAANLRTSPSRNGFRNGNMNNMEEFSKSRDNEVNQFAKATEMSQTAFEQKTQDAYSNSSSKYSPNRVNYGRPSGGNALQGISERGENFQKGLQDELKNDLELQIAERKRRKEEEKRRLEQEEYEEEQRIRRDAEDLARKHQKELEYERQFGLDALGTGGAGKKKKKGKQGSANGSEAMVSETSPNKLSEEVVKKPIFVEAKIVEAKVIESQVNPVINENEGSLPPKVVESSNVMFPSNVGLFSGPVGAPMINNDGMVNPYENYNKSSNNNNEIFRLYERLERDNDDLRNELKSLKRSLQEHEKRQREDMIRKDERNRLLHEQEQRQLEEKATNEFNYLLNALPQETRQVLNSGDQLKHQQLIIQKQRQDLSNYENHHFTDVNNFDSMYSNRPTTAEREIIEITKKNEARMRELNSNKRRNDMIDQLLTLNPTSASNSNYNNNYSQIKASVDQSLAGELEFVDMANFQSIFSDFS
eukprot:TRINITY_DN13863_c0_g1_i1.p1 TRINITY_DN13863_c0_g1~~TRINITY_DN13863_c0_g1_i1.p1  ORF type:complete len:850 (+),score=245.73 TRINITY_DN13863_c0_g1_i1:232-2550(+)